MKSKSAIVFDPHLSTIKSLKERGSHGVLRLQLLITAAVCRVAADRTVLGSEGAVVINAAAIHGSRISAYNTVSESQSAISTTPNVDAGAFVLISVADSHVGKATGAGRNR